MAKIYTEQNRQYFRKAESLELVPYVYNDSEDAFVLGNDVYDISAIIGDTIAIAMGDASTVSKYSEYKKQPVIVNRLSNEVTFEAQLLDLQNEILSHIFGFPTSEGGTAFVPDTDETMLMLVRVRFRNNQPDIVFPKMSMSSRAVFEQLQSGYSVGHIEGTAMAENVAIVTENGVERITTPNGSASHNIISTPMLIMPRNGSVCVHHHDDILIGKEVFSRVDFSGNLPHALLAITDTDQTFDVYNE